MNPAASSDPVRLSKRMAELGLCSRREADAYIEKGWVKVNGRTAVLGEKVTVADRIELQRQAHEQQAARVTVLLNKPVGFVSAQPEKGYRAAVELIREENRWEGDDSGIAFQAAHCRSLAPAGRLDIDSVGLLVLRPAKVSWQNQDQLRFILREGKKRQIRRMCELVGLRVTGLKRIRIGRVKLGALPPGKWRYLRPDERF